MITFLTGEVVSVTDNTLLLDVNHVGFRVFISSRDAHRMPRRGEEVTVYTYMSVREDAISLYGFLSEDDLDIYRRLIQVSGIGPKGGLGILSVMTAGELRMAILTDDAKAIAAAPGIGPKTAKKLILEMKDRVDLEDTLNRQLGVGSGEETGTEELEKNKAEAVSIMTALGYSAAEALRAVKRVKVTDEMSADDILRSALREGE